ncbi:hypothetical protein WICPIJ_001035 [Wickerhamomyces pijperi]|uniref:Uncharacterized protein n=1 Tax=Wickerhamomyces pijperi TaxID=599730 RepID=A0A9P8QCF6_WICPI|nr:hypothetical protein WICPIJ_001035 [Wickerhamomyces pijperi]
MVNVCLLSGQFGDNLIDTGVIVQISLFLSGEDHRSIWFRMDIGTSNQLVTKLEPLLLSDGVILLDLRNRVTQVHLNGTHDFNRSSQGVELGG